VLYYLETVQAAAKSHTYVQHVTLPNANRFLLPSPLRTTTPIYLHLDAGSNRFSERTTERTMGQEQWQGAAEARLPSTPAAAAWPHIADFFALHRYLPSIDVCERVSGGDGGEARPGCARYCASFAPGTEEVATWAREELLELDAGGRRLAYAVVGSNMGFGRYVASMTVLEEEGADAGGCRLVWKFECEPVQGWSRDVLLGYLDGALKSMAARIEEAAAAAVPPVAAGGAVAPPLDEAIRPAG
jgi:hypothetical protein